MTSATDELRRLLDERGVEHYDGTECTLWDYEQTSESTGCYRCSADEIRDGFVNVWMHHLTPAQVIDATLGRGTCHETIINHHWRGCGSCGYIWEFMYGIGKCERPRYCPVCGRKVVE